MLDHTSKIVPAKLADFMPAVEAQLRQDLRNYAVELRQLAYTVPHGVGEHDFLELSGRMRAAADQASSAREPSQPPTIHPVAGDTRNEEC